MKSPWFFLSCLLLGSFPLFPDEEEDFDALFEEVAQEEGPEGKSGSLLLRGDHGVSFFQNFIPPIDYHGYAHAPKTLNSLSLSYTYKNISLLLSFDADFLVKEIGNWLDFLSFRLGENYFSWQFPRGKIETGYLLKNWGSADQIGPINEVNPKDYRRFLLPAPIPQFMLYTTWYPTDRFSLEFSYSPFPGHDVLPLVKINIEDVLNAIDQEDIGLSSGDLNKFVVRLKQALFSTEGPKDFFSGKIDLYAPGVGSLLYSPPPVSWKNASLGLRYTMDFPPLRIAFSYLYEYDSFPSLLKTTRKEWRFLSRDRIHRFSTDFSTTAGPLGLWGEFSVSVEQSLLRNDHLQRLFPFMGKGPRIEWVLGGDTLLGSAYLNVQLIGRSMPFFDQIAYPYPPLPLFSSLAMLPMVREALRLGLVVSYRHTFREERVVLTTTGGYFMPFFYDRSESVRYGGFLITTSVDLKLGKDFTLTIGGNGVAAFWQPQDQAVQLYQRGDSIGRLVPFTGLYCQVRYLWNVALP